MRSDSRSPYRRRHPLSKRGAPLRDITDRLGRLSRTTGLLGVLGLGALGLGCTSDDPAEAEGADSVEMPLSSGGLCGGEPCDAVLRGFVGFFDRRLHGLGGNGRACADCHMATNSFQLSPQDAEARFDLLQWRQQLDPNADDPLFRPVDADDFRTNGQNADDYSTLRTHGLIRITFNLPANVALLDANGTPTGETSVDVWRAVPSVDNVKITGPNDGPVVWPRDPGSHGGYQLDARFVTLQEQANAAFFAHAEVDTAPSQQRLDDLASFERVLFSSSRVRALSDAISAGTTPLPSTDPPLNDLEAAGKVVFTRACAQCHGGPDTTSPQPPAPPRFGDISIACPRPVDVQNPPRWQFAPCAPLVAAKVRTYRFTRQLAPPPMPPAVFVRASSDPGRALLSGVVGGGPPTLDDFQKFDVPSLLGIRNTAPYYHNNMAATLDEVLDHYEQFFKFVTATAPPGVVPPILTTDGVHFDRPFTAAERPALRAYLDKL